MTILPILRFRPAVASDHAAFLRFFAELGVDDPPPDRERFVTVIAPSTFIVEDDGGATVACSHYQVLETDGYVRHVVVDPSARGRGVGRAVMAELGRRFRATGCTRWRLNVKPDNEVARRLYEACGMKLAHTGRVVRIGWEIRASLPDATTPATALRQDELPGFERALDLPPGLLASLGARGFTAIGARDAGGAVVGACAFDARFPGSFPFRARTAEAARALLDASYERRMDLDDAAQPWRNGGVQLVIEDNAELAEALIAAGGDEALATLHYVGDL